MRAGWAIVGLAPLILVSCGAGISLNPGGEPHPDAPIEVLSVNSDDAAADFRGNDARDGLGDLGDHEEVADLAPQNPITDGPTEALPSSDARDAQPQIFEFSVPTLSAHPAGIALGPDGNVWFTEMLGNKIGRIEPSGTIREFDVPTPSSSPNGICAGPDDRLWFTEIGAGQVGRVSVAGSITEFNIAAPAVNGITAGPDGNIWFTEYSNIGRISPLGENLLEFAVSSDLNPVSFGSDGLASVGLAGIVSGRDGNIWASDTRGRICRVTVAGAVTPFYPSTEQSGPVGIASHPVSGLIWFTDRLLNRIGTLDPQRVDSDPTTAISESPVPTLGSIPLGLTIGPDGVVWFTEFLGNRIGSVTADGVITEFDIPTPDSGPVNIVADAAGNIWFTERNGNNLGRLSQAR